MPPERDDNAHVLEGPLAFMRTVWSLSHSLDKRSKWMSSHHGLTGPQRLAVRVIGRLPAVSPGALAHVLHLHPSTLTGIVRRLEERGYVVRARDTSDSRRAMLVLTTAGRKMDQPADGTVEACVARVLARYTDAEVRAVEDVLGALAAELDRGLD